jgi:NADPH-dependent 2,4-dienoyl-CoA reductase/sulfur reductase-like enzyme
MDQFRSIILGGGMVAGYAAQEMAAGGLEKGQLGIISADNAIPYERPPLSKGFLAGDDTESSVFINNKTFYNEHGIDVRLETRVASLDVGARKLTLENGGAIGYEQLLIATGAEVRTFNVPGAELAGIHYLRSLDDSRGIRDAKADAKQAVVIGAGFIGMEVAAVLASGGLDVTLAFPEERVWSRFFAPEMSEFFENYYEKRGVKLRSGAMVTEFEGEDGRVSGVYAEDDVIPADLVVAGIGVKPVTGFLDGSGINVDNGVLVNEYLATNMEGVRAAGDVANYHDVVFDKRRRVEHWDNAVEQGKLAGRLLAGKEEPFIHVPYFFSDVFDLSYEFWGDTEATDRVEYRGNVSTGKFSAWWLRNGIVRAAFVMDRPDEEREAAPTLIQEKRELPAKF